MIESPIFFSNVDILCLCLLIFLIIIPTRDANRSTRTELNKIQKMKIESEQPVLNSIRFGFTPKPKNYTKNIKINI